MESNGSRHRDGVEITSIGALHQGPFEKKYWSSSRGKEKYPYPVGFQATRWHGGHCYYMEVSEGPSGPSFLVKCEEGIACSGLTPSVAWESILKKKHVGAKRVFTRSLCTSIDGPEMFGFTNPLVQRLFRDLVVSAVGAVENSSILSDKERKDGKVEANERRHRKAGSFAESSEKSPKREERGKPFVESLRKNNRKQGAEKRSRKKAKQMVAKVLIEQEQESESSRQEKLKGQLGKKVGLVTKAVERPSSVSSVKGSAISGDEKVSQHNTRSKSSRLRPNIGRVNSEALEQDCASQIVRTQICRKRKSVPLGNKRLRGEDCAEGTSVKVSVPVSSLRRGLRVADRHEDSIIPTVLDAEGPLVTNHHRNEIVSHIATNCPPPNTNSLDGENGDEGSSKIATGKEKRLEVVVAQKNLKREKYDTEVDLTQSKGFLSIDLMCPSAEDIRKQGLEDPISQKVEDISSKQDGYLMLLAACKGTVDHSTKE